MKILLLKTFARVAERRKYNLQEEGIAKEFIRQGHECSLVFYSGEKEHREEIVSFDGDKKFLIHWTPAAKIHDYCFFNKKILRPLVKQADIILTEEFEQWESCFLALTYPHKTIIYNGPYDLSQKVTPWKALDVIRIGGLKRTIRIGIKAIHEAVFLKKMLRKNITIVTKSNLAQKTIESKGFRNVRVVPVGLDIEKFNGYVETVPIRTDLAALPLLYVGEIQFRRDIIFMLKLVRRLRDEGVPATLRLVGSGPDNYVDACKRLCRELNIEAYVEFSGQIEQASLPGIYKGHPVFLLPSKYEIFGMSMLEAMFFGGIVLTTFHGGSDIVIQNAVNGFILRDNDQDSWAKTLIAIHKNKIDVGKISENARLTVINDYTWKKSAAKFIEIFEDKRRENR